MNILFCGYRDWSLKVLENLKEIYHESVFHWVKDKETFRITYGSLPYDFLFFVGWSWMVPQEIVKANKCVCVHPSLLPKWRGGSPVQNQILAGEKRTGVTVFRMDEGMDTGPVYYQKEFDFDGNIDNIFMVIANYATLGLCRVLNGSEPHPQHGEPIVCKRRSPEDSEILATDLISPERLHDKIRMLNGQGYPNAYLKCHDGRRYYVTDGYF